MDGDDRRDERYERYKRYERQREIVVRMWLGGLEGKSDLVTAIWYAAYEQGVMYVTRRRSAKSGHDVHQYCHN